MHILQPSPNFNIKNFCCQYILNNKNVHEIVCLNEEFNPTTMNAVLTEKVEGVEPGIVVEVLQKGYIYNDKVIRPAMVKVSE